MYMGRVTGREVRKNRDGEKDVLLLTVEVSEPDDLQTVELVTQVGEKYNPPDDTTVIILDLGTAWKVAIACDDGVVPPDDLETGERQLYSTEEGILELTKKAIATLRKNGDIELNINQQEDFAVRYSKLEEAFDELKADFNSFVYNYNTHKHQYIPGTLTVTSTGPSDSPESDTTADILPAKIHNIKLPGELA